MARKLLNRARIPRVAEARAAELFRDQQTEDAELLPDPRMTSGAALASASMRAESTLFAEKRRSPSRTPRT